MSKVTREKCAEIIHEFEPSNEAKCLGHMGIDGKKRNKFDRSTKSDVVLLLQALPITYFHPSVISSIRIIEASVRKWIIR